MKEDLFFLGIKGLIRKHDGSILLLKTNRAALKNYSGPDYWDIPGGRIEKGSNPEETLKREIEEETGVIDITNISPYSDDIIKPPCTVRRE